MGQDVSCRTRPQGRSYHGKVSSEPAKESAASETGGTDSTGPLEAISDAIESGAGLPAIARAAARALDASIALIDRSSAVLVVAAGSPAEEEKLLAPAEGVVVVELRVAEAVVGELRYRARADEPPSGVIRMVATLIALELERAKAPEWAGDEAAKAFVDSVLSRELRDPGEIASAAEELGAELSDGAGVVLIRVRAHSAQTGDWRRRTLMLATRAVRAVASGALAATIGGEAGEAAELAAILPVADAERIARAAREVQSELATALGGFTVAVGHSRLLAGAAELYRGGREALLAVNVAEAEGVSPLDFEATGAYRLLLPALSEDPEELRRFYAETIEPLASYDAQYETELVKTADAYLDNDGNVTPTAESLYTHRHTIRYRLERIRELSGHDLTSTEGREKLGLGLKSMRVLGIAAPSGPASESGKGGRGK